LVDSLHCALKDEINVIGCGTAGKYNTTGILRTKEKSRKQSQR